MRELRITVDDSVISKLDWLAQDSGHDGKSSQRHTIIALIDEAYRRRKISLLWDDRAGHAAKVMGRAKSWLSDYPSHRITRIEEAHGVVVVHTKDGDSHRITRGDWES